MRSLSEEQGGIEDKILCSPDDTDHHFDNCPVDGWEKPLSDETK